MFSSDEAKVATTIFFSNLETSFDKEKVMELLARISETDFGASFDKGDVNSVVVANSFRFKLWKMTLTRSINCLK